MSQRNSPWFMVMMMGHAAVHSGYVSRAARHRPGVCRCLYFVRRQDIRDGRVCLVCQFATNQPADVRSFSWVPLGTHIRHPAMDAMQLSRDATQLLYCITPRSLHVAAWAAWPSSLHGM